jgi:hypothetical protein
LLTEEPAEEPPHKQANRRLMVTVTALLVVAGLAMSLVPGLQGRSEAGAERFRDREAYVERVLHGRDHSYGVRPTVLQAASGSSIAYGLGTVAASFVLGLYGLYRTRLRWRAAGRLLTPPVGALKAWHSGLAADYVVWLTLGTALVGGIWAFTLR